MPEAKLLRVVLHEHRHLREIFVSGILNTRDILECKRHVPTQDVVKHVTLVAAFAGWSFATYAEKKDGEITIAFRGRCLHRVNSATNDETENRKVTKSNIISSNKSLIG